MGRGGRHTGYHGGTSTVDNILAADARRIAEAHFARQDGQQTASMLEDNVHGASPSLSAASESWLAYAEAVTCDIVDTLEDRFTITSTIAAMPPLGCDEEDERLNLAALMGYFMSISTLLAFAAYSRRLGNLMSGASPIMGEILFCVSHLSQVTQEQLGWSLFSSGFITPVNFDGPAADGSGGAGGATGTGAAGNQSARRQTVGGGSGGGGAGYASYSGGNVVRYLLGRKASSVLRQESLRSYLNSSFYSPSAFLVEQSCWFLLLISTLDTVTLQRVAVASFFGNAIGWVPVYSVFSLAVLASGLLVVFMYWIPSYEVDEAVLSVLFLQTSLHHVLSAYCASLCITLLFAESMLCDDLRRTFVSTVFSIPHRLLRLSGCHPAVARCLRVCGDIRRSYFYFVDFYFFLGMSLWVSLVLMETAAGISILGIATLLMTVPWLLGSGWSISPGRALRDTLVYVGFYALVAMALVDVVPRSALPFLSNAVQAAGVLLFMVARCEYKQSGGCVYVLLWLGMLVVYLYEKVGTGRGATASVMWGPHETTSRVNFAGATDVAVPDYQDPHVEAMGLLRIVCVTFWQLLSKGLSEEGTQVLHFNVVVLGSMLMVTTTAHAVFGEGIGLTTFTTTTSTATAAATTTSTTSTATASSAATAAAGSPAVANGQAVPPTSSTSVASKSKNSSGLGAVATPPVAGVVKANTNGTKPLSRSSPHESHRSSGANLDGADGGTRESANMDALPVTSEDDATEEAREKEKSTAQASAPPEVPEELVVTADSDVKETVEEVVEPEEVHQEEEKEVVGEDVVVAAAAEVEVASVVKTEGTTAVVEVLQESTEVASAPAAAAPATPVAAVEARPEKVPTPAAEPAAVKHVVNAASDSITVVETAAEESTKSATTDAETETEAEALKRATPKDLVDVNTAIENASLTSPVSQSEESFPSPRSGPNGKTGTSTASKTSRSSISTDEPKKKSRREKERERKKLQQERRKAFAQAEVAAVKPQPPQQQQQQQQQQPAAPTVAVPPTAKPAVKAPALPVPRSQTEGFKKSVAPSTEEATVAAKVEKTGGKASGAREPQSEVQSPPPPPPPAAVDKTNAGNNRKKENPPAVARAAEPKKLEKVEKAEKAEPASSKAKSAPSQASATARKEAAGGAAAAGESKTAVRSPPTPAIPFPLPKPRHEQAVSVVAAKGGASTAPVVAATAPGSTSTPTPQLTAAEKLRRSANGSTLSGKDARTETSSSSTPASQSPTTAKATAPTPAASVPVAAAAVPAVATKTLPPALPVVSTPITVAAATAASSSPSSPPSVPLPRSAQSAEVEAKKESTPARPVHTKVDIQARERIDPLQRAWREMEHLSSIPLLPEEAMSSDGEEKALMATPKAVAAAATAPPAGGSDVKQANSHAAEEVTEAVSSAATDEPDESYDLDRVLNFLKLKVSYTEDDEESGSSASSSRRGGYRGDAFFHPEAATAFTTSESRFSRVAGQGTPGPVTSSIGLFSTVPQHAEPTPSSYHDLTAGMAQRQSASAASLSDTPRRISQPPQPAPEWTATGSGSFYGDVGGDSFASGNLAPSGSSFHVFSTHPQGAAAAAQAAAAAAAAAAAGNNNGADLSPRMGMLSPPPSSSAGTAASGMPGNGLLRPMGTAERQGMGSALLTPPLYSSAGTPPAGYYLMPQQTPPSPMSEPQARPMGAQPLPQHMPHNIAAMTGSPSGLPPSFSEVLQLGPGNGGHGGGAKANGSNGNNNNNRSNMNYVAVGGAPPGADRQQSVFARLRAVPNARGVMGEPMMLSPSPQGNGVQQMPTSTPGVTQPMMVMMTNAEGQMALYPVMYNQPVYMMDANGMMHPTQGTGQQQIVYTTSVASQGAMRSQPGVMAYQMTQDGTFIPPSPPQGPAPGIPPYPKPQQQPY